IRAAQDRPCTEEADAADDLCSQPRRIEARTWMIEQFRIEAVDGRQHDERRTQGDKQMRLQAGLLVPPLPLPADHAAEQSREQQSADDRRRIDDDLGHAATSTLLRSLAFQI